MPEVPVASAVNHVINYIPSIRIELWTGSFGIEFGSISKGVSEAAEFGNFFSLLTIYSSWSLQIVGLLIDFEYFSEAIEATYKGSGNVLIIKRESWDKAPSNLCSVAFTQDYRKRAQSIFRGLKSQIYN